MAVEGSAGDLLKVVTLLGAAVVAVPLARAAGLGAILGYLAAGMAIPGCQQPGQGTGAWRGHSRSRSRTPVRRQVRD